MIKKFITSLFVITYQNKENNRQKAICEILNNEDLKEHLDNPDIIEVIHAFTEA